MDVVHDTSEQFMMQEYFLAGSMNKCVVWMSMALLISSSGGQVWQTINITKVMIV